MKKIFPNLDPKYQDILNCKDIKFSTSSSSNLYIYANTNNEEEFRKLVMRKLKENQIDF